MVLFFPIEQELNCISECGRILGKIRFDGAKDEYAFEKESDSITLSDSEKALIAERLVSLSFGNSSMPMQDDD